MIGTVLNGRYTILEEVGMGGMAHVYKAKCNVLNRIVAVKILRNDLEGGDEFVNRFNAEAQSAACLTHPNIVSIYDVGEENGMYYIVMEYLEGITLKEYIKANGPLTSEETANIALQICSALNVAHEKNIIHRDIKPHNIMVTSNNLVKVTDFGIARASSNSTMRVGDSILGSVHYISPEQARGGYVDCRSDLYSLGIVMYEMLTGKLPFESDSPIAIAMKHLEETPVKPDTLCPDIALELQEIVLKAISKETRNRYQNAAAMIADIELALETIKTGVTEDLSDEDDDIKIAGVSSDIYDEETDDDFDENEEIMSEEDEYEDYDEDDEYDEEYDEKPKSTLNMIIAAVLIALVVVGASSVALLYSFDPDAPIFSLFKNNDVDVPDFIGISIEKAEDVAKNHGLILEVGDERTGPEKKGTVIYQSINEGNSVKRGTHITLHLSSGPKKLDTESYRGMSADIIDEFKAQGYKVSVKYKNDKEIAEDKIISVSQKNGKIVFTVSSGKGDIDCVVPSVLNLTKDQARAKLEDNGLLLNERILYIDSDTVEANRVVEQSIAPGEKVPAKTKVGIFLASKKSSQDNESNPSGSSEPTIKEKTLKYSTVTLSGPTRVKIVEKSSNGNLKTLFDQTVDPETLNEIVIKVKGSGVHNYTIYHGDVAASQTQIDFNK
jgi:serine/threonine-protein kinase